MAELEKVLEKYFLNKAPKLPEDIQSLIVTYGPYILAIGLIISGVGLLSAFGFTALVFNPLRMFAGPGFGMWYQVYLIFTLVTVVLSALALPGLMNKKMAGWKYIYYATLVSIVSMIVSFNIVSLIIVGGISLYVLFQIKHHYK